MISVAIAPMTVWGWVIVVITNGSGKVIKIGKIRNGIIIIVITGMLVMFALVVMVVRIRFACSTSIHIVDHGSVTGTGTGICSCSWSDTDSIHFVVKTFLIVEFIVA